MVYKSVIMIGGGFEKEQVEQIKSLVGNDEDILILGDGIKNIHTLDLSVINSPTVDEETLFVVLGHGNNIKDFDKKNDALVHIIENQRTSALFAKIRAQAGKPVTIAGFSCMGGAVIKQNEIYADGVLALMAAGSKPSLMDQSLKAIQAIIKLKKQSEISNLQIFRYLIDHYPETFYIFDNQEKKEGENQQKLLIDPKTKSAKIPRPGKFTKEELSTILDQVYIKNAVAKSEDEKKRKLEKKQEIAEKLQSAKTRVGADKTTFSIRGIEKIAGNLDSEFEELLEKELAKKLSLAEIKKPRAENIFKDITPVVLIDKDAKETTPKSHDQTATIHNQQAIIDLLHISSSNNNLEVVKSIIKQYPELIDEKDQEGCSALTIAATLGNMETVKALIASNANCNLRDKNGYTPLMIAAQAGHVKIVKTLMDAEASPYLQNKDGNTALIFAAAEGHTEIVKTLISAVAVDINRQNKDGYTALMFAAAKGNTEIVKALIAKKANLDIQERNGFTALIHAIFGIKAEETAKLLIDVGAEINNDNMLTIIKTTEELRKNPAYKDYLEERLPIFFKTIIKSSFLEAVNLLKENLDLFITPSFLASKYNPLIATIETMLKFSDKIVENDPLLNIATQLMRKMGIDDCGEYYKQHQADNKASSKKISATKLKNIFNLIQKEKEFEEQVPDQQLSTPGTAVEESNTEKLQNKNEGKAKK